MERIASEGGDMTLKTYVATNWTTPLASVSESSSWPTPTTQETPHEDMELTETGRRKTKDGKDSHSLNLQDVSANWPTPKAGNPGSRKPGTGGKVLNEEAKKWPTPNVSDNNDPNLKDNHDLEKGYLRGVATTWPTPMQRDYKGFDGPGKKNALKPPELYHSTLQDQETETDGHTCSPSCRRLNPLFAEHLMGLPLGWTCVSGPLETESFQRWQLALSAYLARN